MKDVLKDGLKCGIMEKLGCRVGAAVAQWTLRDERLWELVTANFNAITPENELKPEAMFGHHNAGCSDADIEEVEFDGKAMKVPKLNYSKAEALLDKVLEWNQENPGKEIKVRGHVLVWHSQTPEWFFHENYDKNRDYVDKDTMNRRLEWYIRTVLTHFTGEDSKYKELFYGWDVVNEAVSDSTGTYRSDAEKPEEPLSQDTHHSNSSWWHVYQSNEYIVNAFIYANKYAPGSLELYYNDYNECMESKRKGIVSLLKAVKEREGTPGEGTRIDGMGMQGHYSMEGPSISEIETAVKSYAAVVGNIQITEFDMKASAGFDGSEEAKVKEYAAQAKRYEAIYEALQTACREGSANVTGLIFWGVADHYSWLQHRSDVGGGNKEGLPECPLLFDDKYEPKPAYFVFAKQ